MRGIVRGAKLEAKLCAKSRENKRGVGGGVGGRREESERAREREGRGGEEYQSGLIVNASKSHVLPQPRAS